MTFVNDFDEFVLKLLPDHGCRQLLLAQSSGPSEPCRHLFLQLHQYMQHEGKGSYIYGIFIRYNCSTHTRMSKETQTYHSFSFC